MFIDKILPLILLVLLLAIILLIHFINTFEKCISKGYPLYLGIILGILVPIGIIVSNKLIIKKEKEDKLLISKIIRLIVKISFALLFVLFFVCINIKFQNNKLVYLVDGISLSACIFVQSSICFQIYEKKGLSKLSGSLWGLIPVYGFIRSIKSKGNRNVQESTVKKVYSFNSIVLKLFIFLELCGLSVIVLLPIIYMVGASFSQTNELPVTFWPETLTFDKYKSLFVDYNFGYWYKNTLIIAILNMVIGVICITGAGYVFARFKFKGKKFGLIAILVLQVFPSFMGMIAMYTMFATFGLLGQPVALTILYVGGSIPFNLWLIKGYLSQIPRDLDESAMLDGANKLQIFFKIILPLSVPILSFVAVNQFMAPWMDYMLPRLLLKEKSAYTSALIATGNYSPAEQNQLISQQLTLAVGLFEMISGADKNAFTTFAAGALIVALPITVLYVIFQKFLIEGITAGATKG